MHTILHPEENMKEAKIHDPIFEATIILTFGKMKDVNNWYKKKGLPEGINNNWQAYTEKIDKNGIRYYHIHFEAYGFTTIVHETNHLAFNILNDRGIPFIEETKEVFAYYQDWISGKCRDYLEVWAKKK